MFLKDSATGKSAILAPGEDIIPSNIMRESAFDAKSFPMKHPSGDFALNFERPIRLTKKQFFRLRLLHYTGIYSNDSDYLFMCQQYLERGALEGAIDIHVQKGIMTDGPGGTKTMQLTDAFSVFQTILGTPKFWQQKQNNLLAI